MFRTNVIQSPLFPQFLHDEQSIRPDSSPEKIYFDINLVNIQSVTTSPPNLSINLSRNAPFVKNSGDYYLSIVRFTLDTQTLPIFVPQIQNNQPDVNKTIYSITMNYNGVDSDQIYIDWQPQDISCQIPPPPSQSLTGFQINSTNYYNCMNYQWFIMLISNTMSRVFDNLAAKVDLPTVHAPILTFDSANKIAIISAETEFYDRNLADPI